MRLCPYWSCQRLPRREKPLGDGIDRRLLSFVTRFRQFPIDDLHFVRHRGGIARPGSDAVLLVTRHTHALHRSVDLLSLSYLSESYFCTADFGRTVVGTIFCTAGCCFRGWKVSSLSSLSLRYVLDFSSSEEIRGFECALVDFFTVTAGSTGARG